MAAVPCRIVDGEDDDVKEDTENVDGKAEEDRILALRKSNTPDVTTQKHHVAEQSGLKANNKRIIRDDDKEVPGYPTPPGLPRILVKGVQEKKLSV